MISESAIMRKNLTYDFEIFDFHCHPFYDSNENICVYTEAVNTREGFIAAMDFAGIGGFAGSVIYRNAITPESFDEIHALNLHALELEKLWGGRYVPGIHIHPDFVRESCEELEAMKKAGVRLVGELVPYRVASVGYSDPAQAEILRLAGELGMVVSCHSASMEDLEKAVAACPGTIFVNAHPGEYKDYSEKLDIMKRYPNLYLDVCGTGLFRYGMLKHGVDMLGAERFLFGTDFPVCNAAMQVTGVLSEPLSDADFELIFAGNAKRLLGIGRN